MAKSADKCSMQYRTFFCFVSSDARFKYTVEDEASPKRRPLCVAQAFRLSFALDPKLCIVRARKSGESGCSTGRHAVVLLYCTVPDLAFGLDGSLEVPKLR